MADTSYDLIVCGAGIVGLAHALAAARLGKRVLVIDRDAQTNGASIRNFGFVTVTGQQRGDVWRLARRSRDIWMEVAGSAGIGIEHEGLALVARRPEALAVLEAFMATEMAEGCALMSPDDAAQRWPMIAPGGCAGVLHSTIDARVESRVAVPRLAAWLSGSFGVTILRSVAVKGVESGRVDTTRGEFRADAVVVCPGDDLTTLIPDRIAAYGVTRCKLQMLRLAPPGWRLPAAVMTDLSLSRYLGYAELPEAAALRTRLESEQGSHLANGVHLIAVQSADGSLVVGDSHHYAATPDPFSSDEVDRLILDEFEAVLGKAPAIVERWTGTYASGPSHSIVDAPCSSVRLVIVTSGTGASTGFALAERVIADLFGVKGDEA
jgi:FAD dependent oxidoreductase TIGR03364